MVSIVMPVYNEEEALSKNSFGLRELSQRAEVIFVDGGSLDRTKEIAGLFSFARVLFGKKGRALQMNLGGRAAHSEILLFMHADTLISPNLITSVENKIKAGFTGGCFSQRIDKAGAIYRFIEALGNIRARLTRVFYGDQGIFVRKDIFLKMGGFPEVPVMEDVIFTKKLRKIGKTAVLKDKILVSPRRWEKKGVFRTLLLYSLLNILFWLKWPLKKIKMLYGDLR